MTLYYTHPFTGKKVKIGGVKTKKCKRCKESFFPASRNQILCPYCQSHPATRGRKMTVKYCRLFNCGKERIPGEGANGLCKEHYNLLVKTPRSTKQRQIKAAQKKFEEGAVLCQMFQECEVYFYPKGRNQYGTQKFCPNCAAKRSWDKSKNVKKVN